MNAIKKIRNSLFPSTWLALALAWASLSTPARAQDAGATTNGLTVLIAKVRADLAAGKRTEAALADDLNQFDALLAAENGKPTELAANTLLMKGMLYSEIFDQPDKARGYFMEIKKNYANTKIASKLDRLLAMMDQQAQSKKIQAALNPGAAFPDFHVLDVNGEPMSVGLHKGHVVLVDFWATWCAPCCAEVPNVVATYGKYHPQGFDIIGVSLDQSLAKMTNFTATSQMPWPQYCDAQGWDNALAKKYGIQSIPATILIDGTGKIIGRDLRGEALEQSVAQAVASPAK